MDTMLVLLLAGVTLLVLFRRRLGVGRVAWPTMAGVVFGAGVGFVVISLLAPHLASVPTFAMFPTWLWKLAMTLVGVFMFAAPMRKKIREVLPPRREEPTEDDERE